MMNHKLARFSVHNSAGESVTATLVRTSEGDRTLTYHVECERKTRSDTRHWKRSVAAGYVQHLMRQLAETKVPVMPEEIWGCDGVEYELNIDVGMNGVTYRWWNKPPEGYEAIERFGEELMGLAGIRETKAACRGRGLD